MSALSRSPLLGGRFQLGEKVGEAGGTETWRATEAGADRTYTVLILETGEASPDALAERVRAASRIHHPSILPTVDTGVTDDGRLFVVREQMPGGNLAAYVRRNGPLPPRKAAAVVRGLVAALHAAHAHGVVHGEVEPAKVSVGADNKPRLTWLGLAGVPPRDERPFAAPEATASASADPRSDVYSAGATLFTLLTGKAPAGLTESAIGEGVLASIPPALAQVIHRATRRDPSDRYESAAAMLADLKAIAAVLPQASERAEPARAAPTIAISLDAPLPAASTGRDEETPTQLFDRDVIKMALGDLDRSALGDLQPAIDAMTAAEPSVATMPAGGADLENLVTAPVGVRERVREPREPPPIGLIAVGVIAVAACIAIAVFLGRAPPGAPVPEVAPVPDVVAATPPPPPRVEAPPPVQKSPPVEPVAVPDAPKPIEAPRPPAKKKRAPAPQNPVIAPQGEAPIEVPEDGDFNPRITPEQPAPAADVPAVDGAPTPVTPEAPEEEQIWDTPTPDPPATDAAPATTEPAPATTEPAPATTEPAPATTEPAPAEPSPADPAATDPAPADATP